MTGEPDLRYTHEREVISHFDRPDNSMVICIANYPTDEFRASSDVYERDLAPPNKIWDKFVNSRTKGDQGRGYHRFEGEYLEWLSDNQLAYKKAQRVKAHALVRPVFLAHHMKKRMYSPAWLLIRFIKEYVELPVEREDGMDISGLGDYET